MGVLAALGALWEALWELCESCASFGNLWKLCGCCGSFGSLWELCGALWELYGSIGSFVGALWELCGSFVGALAALGPCGMFAGALWEHCGNFARSSGSLGGDALCFLKGFGNIRVHGDNRPLLKTLSFVKQIVRNASMSLVGAFGFLWVPKTPKPCIHGGVGNNFAGYVGQK